MNHWRVQVSPQGAARKPGLSIGGCWSLGSIGTLSQPGAEPRLPKTGGCWRRAEHARFHCLNPWGVARLGVMRSLRAKGCKKDKKAKDCKQLVQNKEGVWNGRGWARGGRNKRWVELRVTSLGVTSHATHLLNTLGTPFCFLLPFLRNHLVYDRKGFKGENSPLCSCFSEPANTAISWYTYTSAQIVLLET